MTKNGGRGKIETRGFWGISKCVFKDAGKFRRGEIVQISTVCKEERDKMEVEEGRKKT